jgi:hypothetical protein
MISIQQSNYQSNHSNNSSKNNKTNISNITLWKSNMHILFVMLLYPCIFFLFGFYSSQNTVHIATTDTTNTIRSDTTSFKLENIRIYNDYTKNEPLRSKYPWENIVEPYRPTYFEILDSNTYYNYVWYIDGYHQEDGTSMAAAFTSPGSSHIVYCESYMNDNLINNISLIVYEKYVRREIRDLNDQDKELLLQAITIMQKVPTQIGKALYGDNYFSRDYLTRLYLYMTSSSDCNHWQDGPGYLVSHSYFLYLYEQALQSINPSISIPYWDFTLESTFYTNTYSFRNSYIFSSSVFGSACPNTNTDDNNQKHFCTINGRFANNEIMSDAINYSDIRNAYGHMRSPWNLNPYSNTTRSSYVYDVVDTWKPSGCSFVSSAMSVTSYSELCYILNYSMQRIIPSIIGGQWGTNIKLRDISNMSSAYENMLIFEHSILRYIIVLYRNNILNCTDSIRGCYCVETAYHNSSNTLYVAGILETLVYYDLDGNAISSFLNSKENGKSIVMDRVNTMTVEQTKLIYDEILEILCNPGYQGDLNDGIAPHDPLFWVIFGGVERIWHLKKLNSYLGLSEFDETWPTTGFDTTCPGHRYSDGTAFTSTSSNDVDNTVYTNQMLYESVLDPLRDNFPYVYDRIDWEHCTFLGNNY